MNSAPVAMTFSDSKNRFSNRVADYVRYRPGYPAALLDLLREECGMRAEESCVVADIGSGTGLLAELFLKQGNRVFGVEPNQEMREAGEEFLGGYASFTSIAGAAEATTLRDASVNFVTAGQAFHWFEPVAARREFCRILAPGGWMVVVWNDRRMDTPFARDYEAMLTHYGTDYTQVRDSYPQATTIKNFFGEVIFAERSLNNSQLFDWDGLSGRLRSSSYAPTERHANYTPMMEELHRIFRAHQDDGRVRMEYVTRVYFGQLQSAGTRA
ncbi:MAG: class I SAM-dependent methyltransferase [Candidatus Acidiferrum sp.]